MPEQPHEGNWYVLVYGLQLEHSPMHLGSGLTLLNLGAPLTVFDLAAAGAAGFSAWATLEPFAPGCMCEIESAVDAATKPGFDALNRAWLVSATLVLRGFGRHLCLACSAYPWSTIAGHQKRTAGVFKAQMAEEGVQAAVHQSRRELPTFKGQLLDYHLHPFSTASFKDVPVTSADARWIKRHFDTFNKLAHESERFSFSLESAVDWRFQKDRRAAIARLWSGIEAVFGIEQELVFRVSLTIASLLAPRGEERLSKFEAVKKLYATRSKAVHGESLSEDALSAAIGESYDILRLLLMHQVELGRVFTKKDCERAVLG